MSHGREPAKRGVIAVRIPLDEEEARLGRMQESPPGPATVLVGLGVVPFVAGAAGFWLLPPRWAPHALDAQMLYAVAILSFLGAVHWGVALVEGPDADRLWRRLCWSVAPALLAWIAALMTARPALVVLMAGFVAAYFVDLRARDRGELPAWYLRLRRPATALVLLSLGASLLRVV